MRRADVKKLKLGIYRLWWRSGGGSLASVGAYADGEKWMAPVNWISPPSPGDCRKHWRSVKLAEQVMVWEYKERI